MPVCCYGDREYYDTNPLGVERVGEGEGGQKERGRERKGGGREMKGGGREGRRERGRGTYNSTLCVVDPTINSTPHTSG